MHIPRLLFRYGLWFGVLIASLLVLLWAAPAAAQTTSPRQIAPAQPPLLSQPPLSATIPSWDGRTRIPLPVPQAKGGNAETQVPPRQDGSGPRLFQMTPGVRRLLQLPQQRTPPVLLSGNVGGNDERCYAIRDYRFAPGGGAAEFAGSSDCQAATQFHLKGITLAPGRSPIAR